MTRENFIKEKIRENGYSIKDFANKINMPYTTLLSIVNKSVGGASLDNIIKICNGLEISIELLNPNIQHKNNAFLYQYNTLNETGKAKADEYIEDLADNPKYTQPLKNNDTEFASDMFESIADDIKNIIKKGNVNIK